MTGRSVARAAALEFALTAIMLFIVVTATRWLMGTIDVAAGGWWNTAPARLLVLAPIAGYTITAIMLSPWGRRTGGHVNPAITLAMWRYGRTPGRAVAPYLAAQLLGSVAGTAAGRVVWGPAVAGPAVDYAAVRPAAGWSWPAVTAVEALTMFVIVAVVGLGLRRPRGGAVLPWAVGTMIACQIVAFGTRSGGVANPARQFGPALLSGATDFLAVYLLAPPLGALAATVVIELLAARRPRQEVAARR